MTYLKVDIEPHVVVPYFDDFISGRGQVATIWTHLHAGYSRSVHVGHLVKRDTTNSCYFIDPLHMTSHSKKGGRSLDNSCFLCVKTCEWPQRTCSGSCYARGSYWFLTQYRTHLQTKRIILDVNSLLCMFVYDFDAWNDTEDWHTWVFCTYCKGSIII